MGKKKGVDKQPLPHSWFVIFCNKNEWKGDSAGARLYYTKTCNEWQGPSPRFRVRATQIRRNVGAAAALCPIWPARKLNLTSPTPMRSTALTCRFTVEMAWAATRPANEPLTIQPEPSIVDRAKFRRKAFRRYKNPEHGNRFLCQQGILKMQRIKKTAN